MAPEHESTGESKRRYVDTKTRYAGVFARHSIYCNLGAGGKRCSCKPSYWGKVWDRAAGRHRKTQHRQALSEARNLREDLLVQVRQGIVSGRPDGIGFEHAKAEFLADCRSGVALNKQGRPYTRKAVVNLESSLKRLPASLRRKRLRDVSGGDFQYAVDAFRREGLSSSRIRAIVNAARSLYRWAIAREKVLTNAAAAVRLPAPNSEERDRVATPGEFAVLLDAQKPEDALPWALAGYASARLQEAQALEWPEVDLERRVVLLAGDEEARKTEAARADRPDCATAAPPPRSGVDPPGAAGLGQGLPATGGFPLGPPFIERALQARRAPLARGWVSADRVAGLPPHHRDLARPRRGGTESGLGLHGHKAPGRHLHPGAAPITLRRYTHVLAGELERARDQLDEFVASREAEERGETFKVSKASEGSKAVPRRIKAEDSVLWPVCGAESLY